MRISHSGRNHRGFTLIEVLVVVAIIALLLSILLPSLKSAREQTKILICQANSKQVATMVTEYRTEHRGYVPVMYNYWANTADWKHPARTCWLSVALRHYYPSLRNLKGYQGGRFDPGDRWSESDPDRGVWDNALRTDYENTVLPEFFMCPFERGKGPHSLDEAWVGQERRLTYQGKFESYHTWLWDSINRGTQLNSSTSSEVWKAKYPVMIWNKGVQRNNDHVKWEIPRQNAIIAGALSPSDFTVVYCGQGEFTVAPEAAGGPTRRANVGGHRRPMGGGTNAVFADTHVEWVYGKQIGRP